MSEYRKSVPPESLDYEFFVDNVPAAENWMLRMCDITDCINDGRDPETSRFPEFQNSKT